MPSLPKVLRKTTNPKCDLCSSRENETFKRVGKYKYLRCSNCQGIFVYPKKNQKFYIDSEDYLSDPEEYISLIDPRGMMYMIGKFEQHYLEKKKQSRGKVLEIGAGVGYMAFMMFSRDWDVEGMETSKLASEWSQKYLRMNLHRTTLEDFKTKNRYDAFAMVEVLEHFLDATNAINRMKKLSGRKALIFGTTPNTDSEFWKTGPDIYVPSDHIFLFNEQSLKHLAKKTKLKNFTIEYFGSGDAHDSNMMFSGVV